MKERMTHAFDDIRADDALTQKTAAYLREQREAPSQRKRHPRILRYAGALAAMLALVVGLLGYNTYVTPAAYVSVDVNPSIELAINRMDKVIDVYAFNVEGKELLQQHNVIGKRYDEAVSVLITAMEQEGYFTNDALISMTVQATDSTKEQALQDTLRQTVTVQASSIRSTTDVEVFPVTAEIRGEAHECQMSAAKYLAIQELLAVDETATMEQYSGESIRQIRRRTQECQGGHGNIGSSSGNNAGDGQGQGAGSGQDNGHHGQGYRGGR